jgi:hypothetical protein
MEYSIVNGYVQPDPSRVGYELVYGNPSSTGGKHKVRSLCRMTSATTIPSPLSYASGMMHPRAMGR